MTITGGGALCCGRGYGQLTMKPWFNVTQMRTDVWEKICVDLQTQGFRH